MITFKELLEISKSNDIVIHTPTEDQAKALLNELNKKGYKWNSGDKLTARTYHEVYKENTCYYTLEPNNRICYGSLSFYQENDYTIIEFSDINFTDKPSKTTPKSDIKTIYQSKDKLTTCVVFEDGTKVKVKKHQPSKNKLIKLIKTT